MLISHCTISTLFNQSRSPLPATLLGWSFRGFQQFTRFYESRFVYKIRVHRPDDREHGQTSGLCT